MIELIQSIIFKNLNISYIILIIAPGALFLITLKIGVKKSILLIPPIMLVCYGYLSVKDRPIDLEKDYSIKVSDSNTLTLYKNITKKMKVDKTKELPNGLIATKTIEEEKLTKDTVLEINCNNYSYTECILKVKEGLNDLIANKEKDLSMETVKL